MNNVVAFPNPRAVQTDSLVDAMTKVWEDRFNNVSSAGLQASWRQAFVTFNRKIDEHGTKYAADWHILSPKTGTGKSSSLKVYAAETSKNDWNAPGILIVVRMIAQADEFASDINELAGEEIAVSRHSKDDSLPLESLAEYPVLVITHAAFTGGARRSETWNYYTAFDGDQRKLVVIDEAIDVLDIARLDADLMSKLVGAIPSYAQTEWAQGYEAIRTMQELCNDIRALPAQATTEARVVLTAARREYMAHFVDGWNGLDEIESIRKFMRSDDHRYLLGKRNVDAEAELRQKQKYDKIFADLITVYDSFILHWKSGQKHTLNTAVRVLPDDGQGCVVLDATADTNPIYECMERDTHNVLKHTAINSRDYGNATLRASFGHAVGRSSLVRTKKGQQHPGAETEAPKLIQALIEEHSRRLKTSRPMDQVLIVCHKDAKPYLAGFETPFKYDTAHYGSLDGRNDWREFDSVVIFGLDYRHPADAPTQFMALQPEYQTDGWLKDVSKRAFKGYKDIRAAIEQGQIVSSVIQAVNRISTRTVIDADGNCPESYVYMLLPENSTGKAVYNILQEQMPGIQLDRWHFDGAKQARRSKHEEALKAFMWGMVPGESWSATKLREHLKFSKSVWKRLVNKMKDDTTELHDTMEELNIRYEVARKGKTQTARLVKS